MKKTPNRNLLSADKEISKNASSRLESQVIVTNSYLYPATVSEYKLPWYSYGGDFMLPNIKVKVNRLAVPMIKEATANFVPDR